MNAKILAAVAIASLMAVALPVDATGGSKDITYIAPMSMVRVVTGTDVNPSTAGVSIWCAAGGHQYTPIGSPPDPDTSDPVEYVDVVFLGWVFSGEPECAPGDVATGNAESAIGGGAFIVNGHEGHNLEISITDDLFATNAPVGVTISMDALCTADNAECPSTSQGNYQGGDGRCLDEEENADGTIGNGRCDNISVYVCGAGAVSVDLPGHMPTHWQTTEDALILAWGRVPLAMVDLTTNDVCTASSGQLSGAY